MSTDCPAFSPSKHSHSAGVPRASGWSKVVVLETRQTQPATQARTHARTHLDATELNRTLRTAHTQSTHIHTHTHTHTRSRTCARTQHTQQDRQGSMTELGVCDERFSDRAFRGERVGHVQTAGSAAKQQALIGVPCCGFGSPQSARDVHQSLVQARRAAPKQGGHDLPGCPQLCEAPVEAVLVQHHHARVTAGAWHDLVAESLLCGHVGVHVRPQNRVAKACSTAGDRQPPSQVATGKREQRHCCRHIPFRHRMHARMQGAAWHLASRLQMQHHDNWVRAKACL